MFGWFKRKKDNEKCNKICQPKFEIHKIEINNTDNEEEITDLLTAILHPYVDKICNKLHEEGEKGKKAQDKAFNEFDKPLKIDDYFNPWHLAALLIRHGVVREMELDEKNSVKKNKKTFDSKSPCKCKKSSPKK